MAVRENLTDLWCEDADYWKSALSSLPLTSLHSRLKGNGCNAGGDDPRSVWQQSGQTCVCVCVCVCVCGWATAGFKQWMDVVLWEVLNTLRGVRISTGCLLAAQSDRWFLLKLGRQLKKRQGEPIPLVCNHSPSPQWCCGANMWGIHCLISN